MLVDCIEVDLSVPHHIGSNSPGFVSSAPHFTAGYPSYRFWSLSSNLAVVSSQLQCLNKAVVDTHRHTDVRIFTVLCNCSRGWSNNETRRHVLVIAAAVMTQRTRRRVLLLLCPREQLQSIVMSTSVCMSVCPQIYLGSDTWCRCV